MAKDATEAEETLELTDREKAIAAGDDPDAIEDPVEDVEDERDDDESMDADGEGEEDMEVDPPETWIDDAARSLAKSYGLDESDLASFKSQDEFRKTASLFEKMGRKKEPETPHEPEQEDEQEAEDSEEEEFSLDLKHYEDEGYDDNTLNIVKAINKQQQTLAKALADFKAFAERVSGVETKLTTSEQREEKSRLDRAIDEIGGRFGNSDELSAEESAAREKLVEQFAIVKRVLEEGGEEVDTASALRRAEIIAFGDDILAKEKEREREDYSQRVKRQASKRRAVGRNTSPPARKRSPGDSEDPVKAIANDPEIVKAWNDFADA